MYSWLLAYLLSSGVIGSSLFRALVERCRDHARPRFLSTDEHHKFGTGRGFVERKISESNHFFQRRGHRAAGDDTDLLVSVDDRISVPRAAAVDHLESGELAPRSFLLLALDDVAPVVVAFVALHDPREIGFDRRGGVID